MPARGEASSMTPCSRKLYCRQEVLLHRACHEHAEGTGALTVSLMLPSFADISWKKEVRVLVTKHGTCVGWSGACANTGGAR
jgi:hypothetical protein